MATKEQLDAALADLKDVVAAVAGLKTKKGFWDIAKTCMDIVPDVIMHVEKVAVGLNLKGADKHQLAVDIIMHLVSPFIPVWLPNAMVSMAVSLIVDTAVKVFNRIAGKVWTQPAA